ncbi:penicillin acylase family protein [Aquicoccus porphyridii]|uniref:Penicillin acylase family protein n=1 Tax=Aquicoccus porphyridii TaxID=1852029 RepID=A0A5A9YZ53_9RHOB|nr:penicillin acylase family protein [Thalassovita autumnalis]KAA0910180.1 penicillin acylase family protein [Aquicoccus porphyridii]MBS4010959.1 penicillin acylase family protein [Roseovarius sp.]RAI52188.1 penicillin amidase [Rhodobacteraceae bacterium AsT-22]
MKRLFNILLYLLLAVFALGLTVSGVVYFLLRASVPDYDEDFSVAGIEGPVDILRDAAAIPHISADSAPDAYFALGFVHAQDRLGQLLRARRAAQALMPLDRTIEVEPSTAQALDAYAAGVNAWLGLVSEGGRGRGSPDLLIADERMIAAWRPVDSLRLAQAFLNDLQPERRQNDLSGLSDLPIPSDRPLLPELFVTSPKVSLDAWALPGDRTATGAPILAADIRGPLSLPSEWYLADIQLPTGAAIGATLPGVPFIVVGRSERVAWAFRSVSQKAVKEPENPTAAQASNFLMMLDRLARSADVNDAMDACMNLSPAGLEILAIDRETLARWPDREVETPLSFRDARLAALDERQPIFSVEGAITVQRDTVSAAARALLPIMAKELWFVGSTGALEENRADELRGDILDQLAQWNGDMDRFSPEPLVFWAWARALQKRILQDEFPSATKVWARPNPDVLFAVLSDRGGSAIWCDIRPSTRIETCQDQVRAALDDAIGWLVDRYGPDPSAWAWGEAHALNMGWAPIRSSGIISDLLSLEAPSSGDPDTLIATLFTSDNDRPFATSAGTNFQAVMSFSEEAGSYFIAPAGQSGHPLSRFYENLFLMWMQGKYLTMSTDLSLARGGAVGTSRLSPVSVDTPTIQNDRSR